MAFSKNIEEEIDLDKIDEEMKMEKIRQTAAKLSWEGFGQALRKNLMDKKMVFDSDARMDMLVALSVMRKGLPVDEKNDLTSKLRQLSDSLECQFSVQPGVVCMKNADLCIEVAIDGSEVKDCQIAYFSQFPIISTEMSDLISAGRWDVIRSSVHSILSTVPICHSQADRTLFAESLFAFEQWLISKNSGTDAPSFEDINTLPCGFLVARSSLRPSRIFYLVEPSFVKGAGRTHANISTDFDILPYMDLSISLCDIETQMPTPGVSDSTRPARGCFTLKFSTPMVFSAVTWRTLEPFLAKPSSVRQHVNIYRYLSSFDLKDPMLELHTSLPPNRLQHIYQIKGSELKDERDLIIAELHLKNGKDMDKVISLIRAQAQHNSFFISILAMCVGRSTGSRATKVRLEPSARSFELAFATEIQVFIARVNFFDNAWSVSLERMDGNPIDDFIIEEATKYMNRCWSIPVMLCRLFSLLNVEGDPIPTAVKSDIEIDLHSIPKLSDKVGFAWSSRPKKKKARIRFTFQVVEPEEKPIGLLSMLKEPKELKELIPPICPPRDRIAREDLATRTNHRALSDNSLAKNAFSDLEAICQLAESMEDDSRGSPMSGRGLPFGGTSLGGGGVMGSASASPASRPSVTPSTTPGLGPTSQSHLFGQPELTQLENARQRVAQAVSTDAFDFPDDRSNSSLGSFPSPLGNSQQSFAYTPTYTGMSAASSPMSGIGGVSLASQMRGMAPKRRGRGRKVGNVGDRMPDGSILTAADIAQQQQQQTTQSQAQAAKKSRAVRRPRGARKASGVPDHTPYDQRPQLQRSFSDAQYGQQPPTPKSNSSSLDKIDSPYIESESDDGETDPPPPPKNIGLYSHQNLSMPANPPSSAQMLSSQMTMPSNIIPRSVTPAVLMAQAAQAALAAVPQTSSVSSTASSPSQRKGSFDSSKLAKSLAPTGQSKKSLVTSDLYDNGLDTSPPYPIKKPSPPSQKETTRSVQNSPHPFPSPSHSDSSSNPAGGPEKAISAEKKLILKITPKPGSRSSPSVDTMKIKSSAPSSSSSIPPTPKQSSIDKGERKEKKERKEPKEIFGPKCVKERYKRKLEEKEKDREKEKSREHKKHKSSGAGLEKDKERDKQREKERDKKQTAEKIGAVPSVMPSFTTALTNFKIPKKNTSESEAITPTTPISQITPHLSRPIMKRDSEKDLRERESEKSKGKKSSSKHGSSSSSNSSRNPVPHMSPAQIPLPAGSPPALSRKVPDPPKKHSSSSLMAPMHSSRPSNPLKSTSSKWVALAAKERSPELESMQIDDPASPADMLHIADD